MSKKKVDWTRHPYRGIQTEIARELGVTPQAVQYGISVGNPRILELAAKKMEERRAKTERYNNAAA